MNKSPFHHFNRSAFLHSFPIRHPGKGGGGGHVEPPPPPPDEWITVQGRDFVLQGQPIRPMGFNEGHFGSWKASDVPYALSMGIRFIRFELHWFGDYPVDPVLGAVDMRDDTSPGNLRPDAVTYALTVIKAFADAGIRVRIAWHSKCMRTGMLNATDADPYCGDTAYWGPKGGNNVWTNPVDRAKFQDAQVYFSSLTRAQCVALYSVDVEINDNPFVWGVELLNEPQPAPTAVGGAGKTDAAVRDWYAETLAKHVAVRPKGVYITGGAGGYATNKMAAAAQLSMPGVSLAVTADLFNFELYLPDDVTIDTAAQMASLETRIAQVLAVRAAGYAVLLDQVGCNLISDRSRAMFTWLMGRMVFYGIAFEQWEIRRPASYDSAFGWIMDDPDNPDGPHLLMAPTDEAAMIATAAAFKLFDGVSLN